jgi:hypothetical protein|tara:strand:+ start:154 stop:336 length:183 start_codon:yes stop_codon:yes gene_type:complete
MKALEGKKTYTVGIGAICAAIGLWLQDPEAMPLATMLQTVIGSLLAMFLRKGIKTDTEEA